MKKPRPDRDYRQAVGNFFERLARKIIDADDCEKELGDFVNWQISTGVEVKGGDNNHAFRIRIAQLDEHAASCKGFPFSAYVYCLFGYKNRQTRTQSKGKVRKSLLAKCRNEDEVCVRLAYGDIRVTILDVDFLVAMSEKIGQSKKTLLGMREEPVIEVSHGYLERLKEDPTSIFKELGLDKKKWLVEHVHVLLPVNDFFIKTLRVPVTLALKRRLSKKVETVFYPHVKDSQKPLELTAA